MDRPYLRASPDAIIGDAASVEVECPYAVGRSANFIWFKIEILRVS